LTGKTSQENHTKASQQPSPGSTGKTSGDACCGVGASFTQSNKLKDLAKGSIDFGGQQNDEVLVKYPNIDPLRRLMGSGFNV